MTKQEELDKLYSVRRRLLCGESVENVRYGDRTVAYRAADIDRVEARIREIEADLGINTENRRRGIGVHYG